MKTLKQVIHYPDTNSIEATWIDRIQLPDVEVPEVSATEALLHEKGNVITSPIEADEYEKKLKHSARKVAKEIINDAKKRRTKPCQYKKILLS